MRHGEPIKSLTESLEGLGIELNESHGKTTPIDMRKLRLGDKVAVGEDEPDDFAVVKLITPLKLVWSLPNGKVDTIVFAEQRKVDVSEKDAFTVHKVSE